MSAFFGNMLVALKTGISATTLSAVANATTSSITASVSGGRGTYTYLWSQSGTSCTIGTSTSASTTFTGSSVAGTTTVYCNIKDTITGNTLNTDTCVITWTAVPVTQNVVISGSVTYNGAPQAYTLTGTPSTPAPSGTPSTFTNVGTYVYPTNISITAGSGYTLGTVSGSFVISAPTLTVSIPSGQAGGGTTSQTLVTTINGGVPPYTLVSWVKNAGLGTFGATSVNSAVVNKSGGTGTTFTCTVTIKDSLNTQASGSGGINWNIV